MQSVQVEHIGDMAIVACEGRIVRSDAAFRLRDAVTSQDDVRTIVLDLTDVRTIDGGGLGMLTALSRWAQDHDIQLKLFNPAGTVASRLASYNVAQFDIATFSEMMDLVAHAEGQRAKAA